jgi:hypothetical protein
MNDIFAAVYGSGVWGQRESLSGFGSNLIQTALIREAIPKLVVELGICSFLDIPCGDGYWMQHMPLDVERYIGADVVPEIIAAHARTRSGPGREFRVLDVARSDLPAVDMIFCRDCLVHFSLADARSALANIKRSEARFLIATTFPGRINFDISTGQWRPLDLCAPPFDLLPPLRLINEGCTEADGEFADKSLGLWWVKDL